MENTARKWSSSEINILTDLYPMEDVGKIAEILGRTHTSVLVKASRLGLHKDRYTYDAEYFDAIDSADKAYWLGFITADGYVTYNPNTGNYCLGITLSSTDKQHLDEFRESIKSNAPIIDRERRLPDDRGRRDIYQTSTIRIYSKHIVESLKQYGVVPNKTYILKDINVPELWVSDYIRGYFDGDGTFSYSRVTSTSGKQHTYGRIGFVCYSKCFLSEVQKRLASAQIPSIIRQDRSWWTLEIRRQAHVKRFCEYIYNSPDCIKLDRKYQKYVEQYAM